MKEEQVGDFRLSWVSEAENRWTDDDGIWLVQCRKDVVLCMACMDVIRRGERVFFCMVRERPFHVGCRGDHSVRGGGGGRHVDRRGVLVTATTRKERLLELRRNDPEHQRRRRRKVKRRILKAVEE